MANSASEDRIREAEITASTIGPSHLPMPPCPHAPMPPCPFKSNDSPRRSYAAPELSLGPQVRDHITITCSERPCAIHVACCQKKKSESFWDGPLPSLLTFPDRAPECISISDCSISSFGLLFFSSFVGSTFILSEPHLRPEWAPLLPGSLIMYYHNPVRSYQILV